MSRWSRVAPALPGATRVVLAGGAAGGLVWLAATHPPALDLVAASGSEAVAVSGTSLVTSLSAMCPGDELTGIRGVPDVKVKGRVAAASGPADLLPQPTDGAGSAELTSGTTVLAALGEGRPDEVEAALPSKRPVLLRASGALAPAVAATQEWQLDTKDLRGLVTAPCLPARSDLWLVAGGAGAGRQERLVLLNPGGNPVTADVSVHGEGGQVGDVRTVTVPAAGSSALLLDAWAGTETQPAVHVVADGGGLAATLTETWLDGSTARGADTVGPTDSPRTTQVVPGALLGEQATLRVAVPGEEQAVVRVSVLGREGLVPTTETTVLAVAGGSTGELALPAVDSGIYSVLVSSDVPVVAGVVTDAGTGTSPGDIAWASSAPAVTEVSGAALPSTTGVTRDLSLVTTAGSATAVVRTTRDGVVTTRKVRLSSEHTASVDLDGADAVWVERGAGSGVLRAAVVSTSGTGTDRMVSVLPLAPAGVSSPVSRAFPLP